MVFIQEITYPKTNDKLYVINLNEYKSIWTHWIDLYVIGNNRDGWGTSHDVQTSLQKKF